MWRRKVEGRKLKAESKRLKAEGKRRKAIRSPSRQNSAISFLTKTCEIK
jgi:hypothetical protein